VLPKDNRTSSAGKTGEVGASPRRPADRTYGRLHWTFMGVIAAILVYGFVVTRLVQTPRGVGFRLAMAILLSFNVLWWTVADRRFARYVRSPRRSAALRAAVLTFTLALNAPLVYILATASMPAWLTTGPNWYAAAVTLWNLGLAAVMPIAALARLSALAMRYAVRVARHRMAGGPRPIFVGEAGCEEGFSHQRTAESSQRRSLGEDDCPAEGFDPGRRAFLQTALAGGPMILLGWATAEACRQEGQLAVHLHEVPAPWLPSRLRGLTITHLSDLHVGRHYRPHLLGRLVELANGLDGDLVVVTGDVVDSSNDFLPAALEALGRLRHRYGLFACIGNHDEIDSRGDFIAAARRRLPLLINERRTLEIGGERLTVAGLDYAGDDEPTRRRAGRLADIAETFGGYETRRDGPAIVLSHHPHAFDLLAGRGVPLTLSGHTHGGQLMLSRPGERPDVGVGSLLFRYLRGFYHIGDSTLFVNSGVGNWFPLRVNAPAEIVRIRLV
jgi:hypothetical protein